MAPRAVFAAAKVSQLIYPPPHVVNAVTDAIPTGTIMTSRLVLNDGVAEGLGPEATRQLHAMPIESMRAGETRVADIGNGCKVEVRVKGSYASVDDMRRCAERGDPIAQFTLGLYHRDGSGGGAKDYAEAARLFQQAAAQGHAAAQCNLGVLFSQGTGVPRDVAEAARLYGRAAAQGHGTAESNLASCYLEGMGVRRDPVEAARLYELSVAHDYGPANAHLGLLRARGAEGVPRDPVEAGRLLWVAERLGVLTPAARNELAKLQGDRAYASAICMGCGATRKLKTCTKCQVARFCGAECQRKTWATHKPHCAQWAQAHA